MTNLSSGGAFEVKPFSQGAPLSLTEQPYRWSCRWKNSDKVEALDMHFGLAGDALELQLLAFAVGLRPGSSNLDSWVYWNTNLLGATISGGSYPRKNVEAALRGHTDHLMATMIAGELERQHTMLWDALKGIVSRGDHAKRSNGVNEVSAWLSQHNGVFDLGNPQFRQDASARIDLRRSFL